MKGAAQVRRGWKYYGDGNFPAAEAEFSKAVEATPKLAFGHLQLGMFWLRQDRFDEAVSCFERAAAIEPTNPAPAFFLTLALEQADRPEAADRALDALKSVSPRHQGLTSLRLLQQLRRGDPLPILSSLGFGLPLGEKPQRESWRSLVAGIGAGDPEWLPPDLSSSNYLMGPILIEIEKRLLTREFELLEWREQDLIAQLEGLSAPKRSLRDELKALPTACASGSKLRKGKRLLNRAIVAEPSENPKALAKEAIALLRLGRRLDPFAFRTDYHLGEAYLVLAKGAPGQPYRRFPLLQAERAFIRSVQLDGVNPYVLYCLAFVSHALGRPATAIDAYTKATERFTKLPEAHYGSGQCHLLLGQTSQARDLLLSAVNSDLALAKERINLFATLLREDGPEAFARPFPQMPPKPEPAPLQAFKPTEESAAAEPSFPSEAPITPEEPTNGEAKTNSERLP